MKRLIAWFIKLFKEHKEVRPDSLYMDCCLVQNMKKSKEDRDGVKFDVVESGTGGAAIGDLRISIFSPSNNIFINVKEQEILLKFLQESLGE